MKLARLEKLLKTHKLVLSMYLIEDGYSVFIYPQPYEGNGVEKVAGIVPFTHIQEDVVSVVAEHLTANQSYYEEYKLNDSYQRDAFRRHLGLFAEDFHNILLLDTSNRAKGKFAPKPSKEEKLGGRL